MCDGFALHVLITTVFIALKLHYMEVFLLQKWSAYILCIYSNHPEHHFYLLLQKENELQSY
jgi:hypothetical protein